MARRTRGRAVDGVLLLDKPLGLSSNHALQRVKRIFFAQKAGHTGALDPLATGMLPICLGEATKFSQFLLDSDKRYVVTAKLGIRTTTSDADGEVVAERAVDVSEAELVKALEPFRGDINQVPSMYSALKHEGKPLYWYARQGIEIERPARPITIFELKLLAFEGDEVSLEVHCSKGTYIRSLVDDLGELLGCGAHVASLRRTAVRDYPYANMVTLEQLEALLEQAREQEVEPSTLLDPLLMAADSPVADLPEVSLLPEVAGYLLNGQPVQVPKAPAHGLVRVFVGEERRFVGLGQIDEDGRVAPKRLIQNPNC
ncbi:tRNA pseudouridine(55) synthase TruB [Corallincola holothuriorum]|uniref:tRNA pseudouridine synthase B n=1 Tax=Corallincola holothuriorum TaxID=2282215 RepID=A0A368N537_9GAMM|nr:tRNA pseudouridine(55) synthase TruB [Corallincola holothuriorum]RCU44625.1 tRNA pseudouridine(55) synthase TruB [Corallincola holothuriorum]